MPSRGLLIAAALSGYFYFYDSPDALLPIWEFELANGRYVRCTNYEVSPCGLRLADCEADESYKCNLKTIFLGEIDPD